MARLFDAILVAPEKSYENANDLSNSANSLVVTVNRMMTNSPHNVSFLEGANIAFRGNPLDCSSNKDAGGISDSGSGGFSDGQNNDAKASVSINGETVCAAKGDFTEVPPYTEFELSLFRDSGVLHNLSEFKILCG